MNEEEARQTKSSGDDNLQEREKSTIFSADSGLIKETIVPKNKLNHSYSTKAEVIPNLQSQKNWKNYLWEFLMLFLAVFCGYYANYKLDAKIEKDKEKEYAQALYDELLTDSIVYSNKLNLRVEKIKDCDYLASYIQDSSLTDLPKEFYPAFTNVFYLINSYTFEPKDGVLSQLKGSGSLRYFKSPELQKLFGDLSVAINNVRYRNEQEYQFFADPLKPFLLKHYDFKWIDDLRKQKPQAYTIDLIHEYRKSNEIIKATILNTDAINRQEVVNTILFHKTMVVSSRTLQLNDYILINRKIVEALRKNYSLKNE